MLILTITQLDITLEFNLIYFILPSLRVQDDEVRFNVFNAVRHPTESNAACSERRPRAHFLYLKW